MKFNQTQARELRSRFGCQNSNMSSLSIVLLMTSGLLHASWNFLLKASDDKFTTLWWAYLLGGLAFAPWMIGRTFPSPDVWLWLLISVLVEIIYLVLLSISYQKTDLSVIYPIGRGSAPVFITLWSILLMGEKPGFAGLFGIFLIIIGIGLVSYPFSMKVAVSDLKQGLLYGLLIGLTISCYTMIDGAQAKRTDPIMYSWLVLSVMPIVSAPLFFNRFPINSITGTIRKQPMRIVLIGVLTFLAYTVALVAYGFSYISYAGSIREVGIVFAAMGGWLLFKERLGWQRLVGAMTVFSGILVIGILA